MDNKPKRRKFLKSEEIRIYEESEKNKYKYIERLRVIGFPDKPLDEAYRDCSSKYAW